ncbi:MAG: hypothetical protein ACFCD0_02265 [Gemmataceae bacterium]
MSTPLEWSHGFARQAYADFQTWQILANMRNIPECHKLLFLQMACEKLCKAHLMATGTDPAIVQTSHGYVAKPLPEIIKHELALAGKKASSQTGLVTSARHFANEIEALHPSIDRGCQRPDNCEYPWDDDQQVLRSPLDWTFAPSRLAEMPFGRQIVKLIWQAILRLLPEQED